MSRILAIDYGEKRVGVAVTDIDRVISTPLKTVANGEVLEFIREYLKIEKVGMIVVGWPIDLKGRENATTDKVIKFIEKLKDKFAQIPVCKHNERFTSVIATNAIKNSGIKKQKRRDKSLVDMVSACIILQSFINSYHANFIKKEVQL